MLSHTHISTTHVDLRVQFYSLLFLSFCSVQRSSFAFPFQLMIKINKNVRARGEKKTFYVEWSECGGRSVWAKVGK